MLQIRSQIQGEKEGTFHAKKSRYAVMTLREHQESMQDFTRKTCPTGKDQILINTFFTNRK